ncbi:phosphate acetyltransferase [Methylomarinum sp. Ch1-1]|uniref:Phosphate acetyltransferase n=1 Tax=Methylomarinum roseum TaxID=3067653 RepID=A0AAU7NZU4_9GAMM|nr:phosphate acetyltransferase [Methylomarinum sp. Ch1-1]MDP4521379.1 phosphate acetyltransferase [Methylomarinum sp. Ch1-1]
MAPITHNIYITGAEQGSGKSVIMLAMMELFSGHADKVGFFRPIIHSGEEKDDLIEVISNRYQLEWPYEAMYGCSDEEAYRLLANDRYEELLKTILSKYRSLKAQCDHVLCVGSDYKTGSPLFEFDFNADVANNLGCLLMPVIKGKKRNNTDIIDTLYSIRHAVHENGCDLLAAVINNVDPNQVDALRARFSHDPNSNFPVYIVPAEPSLERPSIGDIARTLNAKQLATNNETLNLEVYNYKVAAMIVPDFLDYLEKGDLIITPGDRSDIILACLMAYHSKNYPQIAGLLLTGEQEPAHQVKQLIDGLGEMPFAVLGVATDTFTTAMNVTHVHARLHAQNQRKIATALGLVENNLNMEELKQRLLTQKTPRMTPLMFEYELLQRAKTNPRHIVLCEGEEERILRAAEILLLRGAVKLTLLGNEETIRQKIQALALQLDDITIIDPLTSDLRQLYANTYHKLREHKGVVFDMAYDLMADVSYFGTMMVHLNHADGMVSGAVHTTQHTIRPAFEIIKTKAGTSIVSSVFFMCLEDRVLIYGDCAVNPAPTAQQLAEIAISSAQTAAMFHISPRIAMLSYSTGASGKGEAVEKVRKAVALAKALQPDLKLEGPMQYDAAVDASVARTKLPDSEVAGQANVFIFPDLNTGNNTYKAVQRSSGAIAIGPVLQGLNKPVNDLSRGCTIPDIVNTVLITAIQAQG